jgi:hypothetical protein
MEQTKSVKPAFSFDYMLLLIIPTILAIALCFYIIPATLDTSKYSITTFITTIAFTAFVGLYVNTMEAIIKKKETNKIIFALIAIAAQIPLATLDPKNQAYFLMIELIVLLIMLIIGPNYDDERNNQEQRDENGNNRS